MPLLTDKMMTKKVVNEVILKLGAKMVLKGNYL